MTTTLPQQIQRFPGSRNPAFTPGTPQDICQIVTSKTQVTRTTAMTTASGKACVFLEPGDAWPFQDSLTNGRYFLQVPPRGSLVLGAYGTGNAGKEGLINVWGWNQVDQPKEPTIDGSAFWVPTLLAQVAPVLGAATGLVQTSGHMRPPIINTSKFADDFTIVLDETLDPGIRVIGGGGDSRALAIMDYVGHAILELELTCLDSTGAGTNAVTGISAFWRTL